jgi:hypothetical protein
MERRSGSLLSGAIPVFPLGNEETHEKFVTIVVVRPSFDLVAFQTLVLSIEHYTLSQNAL